MSTPTFLLQVSNNFLVIFPKLPNPISCPLNLITGTKQKGVPVINASSDIRTSYGSMFFSIHCIPS